MQDEAMDILSTALRKLGIYRSREVAKPLYEGKWEFQEQTQIVYL